MGLWADFLNHDGREIHKWAHYFPAYERHFGRYVNRSVTLLEIGCGHGGSLQMWKRYLGPNARIVGIDNNPDCLRFEESQIAIRIGDQFDAEFLRSVVAEFGPPDIVLDDGSHIMEHVVKSFSVLYPLTAPDGVYFVEDLHTAYYPDYGGGLRKPGTFIELSKALIDQLNAHWTNGEMPVTEFNRTTQSMHFYDSLAVFERGRPSPTRDIVVGSQNWSKTAP